MSVPEPKVVAPSMNVTFPVGVPAVDVTVVVKVTDCPYVEGFSEEPSAAAVGVPAGVVAATSTEFGPSPATLLAETT